MIEIRRSPPLSNEQLNALFAAAWPNHESRDFRPVLDRSLAHIAAFSESRLVAFVNLAWDGGVHGFILDTTVHPDFRRSGIAQEILQEAANVAREHELEWLHVDFEPELESVYRKAGYEPTAAGLLRVSNSGAA